MKLRNKKTGKIVELQVHHIAGKCYESLADVNKDWEDYEEPKDFWFIDDEGDVEVEGEEYEEHLDEMKQIGNYFQTKEEAEKAVEKLKAWKRLKDCGFKFRGWEDDSEEEHNYAIVHCFMPSLTRKRGIWEPMSFEDIQNDLDLLFGGGE